MKPEPFTRPPARINLPDNAASENISVQVVRGDDFFTANHLPPITLLKMDVEGYETKVLEGLRETIWRDRPPIFVEIQKEHYNGSESRQGPRVKDLLYPDHIIFQLAPCRRRPVLN